MDLWLSRCIPLILLCVISWWVGRVFGQRECDGDVHDYLSTGCGCQGDELLADGRTGHEYCQGETGAAGLKKPGVCKFCKAPCVCPCHQAAR